MLPLLAAPVAMGALQGAMGAMPGMSGLPGIGSSGGAGSTPTSTSNAIRDTISKAINGDYYGTSGAGQRGGMTNYFAPPQAAGGGINLPGLSTAGGGMSFFVIAAIAIVGTVLLVRHAV